MKKVMKKMVTMGLALVLAMSMGLTSFAATNKKQVILDEMMSAATELGVQNSTKFKNAYDSVAAYEGTITDEQYEAALAEIAYIKDAIASKGVDTVRNDEALMNELITHVIKAAEAVGVTIVYEGEGAGHVSLNTSDPIKQTGTDYTAVIITVIAIAAVIAGCHIVAGRKKLYA